MENSQVGNGSTNAFADALKHGVAFGRQNLEDARKFLERIRNWGGPEYLGIHYTVPGKNGGKPFWRGKACQTCKYKDAGCKPLTVPPTTRETPQRITVADPATVQNNSPVATSFMDPWDQSCAPPFPMDALPAGLRAFVEYRSRSLGCTPSAVAMCSLAGVITALTQTTQLRMNANNDDWMVRPRIWLMLIGYFH
jgi:hypothetical protein